MWWVKNVNSLPFPRKKSVKCHERCFQIDLSKLPSEFYAILTHFSILSEFLCESGCPGRGS